MKLATDYLKNVRISADFIPAEQISARVNSLDNRLSDISIDPTTATSADVVQTLSAIISRFGGNR